MLIGVLILAACGLLWLAIRGGSKQQTLPLIGAPRG